MGVLGREGIIPESCHRWGSAGLDRLNTGDFGYIGLEVLFDAQPERHIRGRAANARPVHTDMDNPGLGDSDELDVAAVVLNRWADAIDHHRDPFKQREIACIHYGLLVVDRIAALCEPHHVLIVGDEPRRLPANGQCTTLLVMNMHARLIVLFAVLVASLLLPACTSGSKYEPSGNPLLDLRNPELLERDRIAAARLAWEEVEEGIRDRERTRYALKNLAWSGATERELRLTVLELLMSDRSAEGAADSRSMARLILPNERDPDAVLIIAQRAVDSGWNDMIPSLVRSLSRPRAEVPDRERVEYRALRELRPGTSIEQVVFDVFLHPGRGLENQQELAVLRVLDRTRDESWGLLGRLDPSGELRRRFLATDALLDSDTDPQSRELVMDLRAARDELGVIPNTAMEVAWLHSLRHHDDPRNRELNAQWWSETRSAVSQLGTEQRTDLQLRHLEPLRWASVNRPAWLELDREGLYVVLNERIGGRAIYKRKSEKGEPPRKERLGDWYGVMPWGDLLSVLMVDDVLSNPIVRDQIFTQRELDTKDTSTEYGGVFETDPDTGWRAVLYRPRQRDRVSDQRFVASDDMFRFSDRSLAHYHFHVDTRNNDRYAGPSAADLINSSNSGRTDIVFTSLGREELNVDVYFPNGVVIDLGRIEAQR